MANSGDKGKHHVTETPDTSHVRNVDVTHETSDVNVRGVATFIGALTALTIIVFLVVLLLFRQYNTRAENEPPPGPMALPAQERLPPEPRLQVAPGFQLKLENGQVIDLEKREPQAEYQELRKQWEESLKEGARDQSGKVVGIPIDDAIKTLGTGNALPSRPGTGTQSTPDDLAVSVPTFASSGRVSEKLR
jgi:hypothetical protein